AYPHLGEARRARVRVLVQEGLPLAADALEDVAALEAPGLAPAERLAAAAALREVGRVDDARRVLAPALRETPVHVEALAALATLAAARGEAAVAGEAERLVAEAREVHDRAARVRRDAIPEVTRLVEARDALALWERFL